MNILHTPYQFKKKDKIGEIYIIGLYAIEDFKKLSTAITSKMFFYPIPDDVNTKLFRPGRNKFYKVKDICNYENEILSFKPSFWFFKSQVTSRVAEDLTIAQLCKIHIRLKIIDNTEMTFGKSGVFYFESKPESIIYNGITLKESQNRIGLKKFQRDRDFKEYFLPRYMGPILEDKTTEVYEKIDELISETS